MGAPGAVVQMQEGVTLAHLLKVSEEEMQLITNERTFARGSQALLEMGPLRAGIAVQGCDTGTLWAQYLPPMMCLPWTRRCRRCFHGRNSLQLRRKAAEDLRTLPAFELEEIVRFGNAAGSLTTTAAA